MTVTNSMTIMMPRPGDLEDFAATEHGQCPDCKAPLQMVRYAGQDVARCPWTRGRSRPDAEGRWLCGWPKGTYRPTLDDEDEAMTRAAREALFAA